MWGLGAEGLVKYAVDLKVLSKQDRDAKSLEAATSIDKRVSTTEYVSSFSTLYKALDES